jgi:plastocyanin
MRPLRLGFFLLPALAMAGCSGGDGVKEVEIHIGWNADGTQYMTPSEIRVQQGDKVRFVVVNDDDPNKDYNGAQGGKDNFHDVALDYPGACSRNPIEHEAPAGQAPAVTECTVDEVSHDYFVAKTRGTFDIVCEVKTVPSHEDLGMRAAFIVE